MFSFLYCRTFSCLCYGFNPSEQFVAVFGSLGTVCRSSLTWRLSPVSATSRAHTRFCIQTTCTLTWTWCVVAHLGLSGFSWTDWAIFYSLHCLPYILLLYLFYTCSIWASSTLTLCCLWGCFRFYLKARKLFTNT